MKRIHTIEKLTFDAESLTVVVDGKSHRFLLADVSSRLLLASASERERYEISPSGYGIHWPLLDEDLSVVALLTSIRMDTKLADEAAHILGENVALDKFKRLMTKNGGKLTFEGHGDLMDHPERVQAVDASLIQRVSSLVDGVAVDLDAPLLDEDE
jgi:hypothetical protein